MLTFVPTVCDASLLLLTSAIDDSNGSGCLPAIKGNKYAICPESYYFFISVNIDFYRPKIKQKNGHEA